jgi:hypothetical protein
LETQPFLKKETAMSNMWGRMGAPMVQPTKDELRQIISDQQNALANERLNVIALEGHVSTLKRKLDIAQHKLGEMVVLAALEEERANPPPESQPRFLRRA